tara:strand:+ start:28700 stop:29566 length:867 start_codon:yes stop_codon:yes gene_type:complete
VKKIAIIEILGGLGNQLFQLAFANYLKKNNVRVLISTNILKKVKNEKNPVIARRDLAFPLNYFGLHNINYFLYKFLKLIKKLKISVFLNKATGKKIFGYANQDKFNLNNLYLINEYYGYWQKSEFLLESKDFLVQALSNEKSIQQALLSKPVKGSTALHIRRTDYVEMDEDLSINFYKEAILYCKKNVNNFRYSIFTDDIEWVKSQSIFNDTEKIYSQEDNIDKTVQHFSEMIKFENFIVGNSTYSLMAAIIRDNKFSKIIIADPWFRNQKYNDFQYTDWIKIKNVKT